MERLQTLVVDSLSEKDLKGISLAEPKKALRGRNKNHIDILNADKSTGNNMMIAGKRFHLIGAGGVGMSGLAALLMKHKAIVTGSDQNPSAVTERLCYSGADIKIGHNEDNLAPNTDAVVISAAIREENPELALARRRNCKVFKYAEILGELMSFYDGIAVAGTHGKSTTSGWLTYLLKQTGIDTNFVIGADIAQLGASSGVADSRFFVAEACEFDRSFLNLNPKIACILNIEQDHLDYYKDENEIVEAFEDFALGTKPNGVLIANGQDANVEKILSRHKTQDPGLKTSGLKSKVCSLESGVCIQTFGLDEKCDFYADNLDPGDGCYAFDVYQNGQFLGRTKISIPGVHNVLNALAVIAMAVNLGIDAKQVLSLLGGFTGMDRRLMLKGQFKKTQDSRHKTQDLKRASAVLPLESGVITVLDDYAHHPTEIKASLAAIRQRYKPRKLWCVFQPHQYSRTRFLLNDFAESFKIADVTIVPEIYFVRDSLENKKQINAQILVEKLRTNGTDAIFIDGFDVICEYLKRNVSDGDVVVTMGAGDIWKVADEYIQWIGRNS
jgi:UDP-N-acetylmuramate--alanine ligase